MTPRKLLFVFILVISSCFVFAQGLTTAPDGGNKKASVTERIGITDVTIHYDRPAVKGREGKIWGQLVANGFTDLGFGTSKSAPWRAGANENTTIEFSTDVMIEGKPLAAGKYALFMAMGTGDAAIIFSRNSTSWGSYFYDPKEDALRVNVKTIPLNESVERLKYEFMDQTDNSATVNLSWEKLRVPFKVEVDYVKTQMESFAKELRNDKGFRWEAWVDAVNFAVEHNADLQQALQWSEYAVAGPFIGQKNFRTLSAKASVLKKMGKTAEADALMKEAMPMANMQELHNHARQLLRDKKNTEALEAFRMNEQKNPNKFMTSMGLARGYSANGDFKNALKYAKAAHAMAPDKANKDAVDGFIKMLEQGRDINQ
jgi:Protein of unknown function (DUF2911)